MTPSAPVVGTVISAVTEERVRALVYVAALTPDEGETVAEVFYREQPHADAPQLAPDTPEGEAAKAALTVPK